MSKRFTHRDAFLFSITFVWAIIGFARYWASLSSQTADAYLSNAWRNLRYSDIAFLWFRDGLDGHPIPYVNYLFEYPVLLGATSYLFSLAGSLKAYFALTYVLLTASALIAVYVLDRIADVDAAYLALAPGLVFYLGLNWDLAAIGLCVVGLALLPRFPLLGVCLLTAAVWFKFFPVVFLGSVMIERLRTRKFREGGRELAVAASTTLLLNGPFALKYFDRWSFFFRLNKQRPADSNLWVLFHGLSPSTINLLSALLLVLGALAFTAIAWSLPGDIVLPLGAVCLVWWMTVNKTFQPQYITWVFLACALLRPPKSVWVSIVLVDLIGYATSFLYQYEIHQSDTFGSLRSESIEIWTHDNLYVPIQLIRSAIFIALIVFGVMARLRTHPANDLSGHRMTRVAKPSPQPI